MRITLITIALLWGSLAYSQSHEFTLVSYNSLRYSPTNIDARHPDLRMIHNDLKADILCIQELSASASAQMYMDSVLNFDSTTYAMATFINGNDLDVALYYKSSKFTFIETRAYPTTLRHIFHFSLVPTGITDTLHIFGLHLKASTGSTNQQRRKDEIDVVRQVTDQFANGTNFIICGDFNIYSANEPAYARLLENTQGDEGHVVDPFTLTGTWNNAAYAMYHTQSPRTTSFNGGATGGMDDRFDMILFSEALNDSLGLHYVQGSTVAYGNDGLHYNMAINDAPTNAAVGQVMADALHFASDHIPVIAKFAYNVSGVSVEEGLVHTIDLARRPGGVWLDNPGNMKLLVSVFTLDGRRVDSYTCHESEFIELPKSSLYLISISEIGGKGFLSRIINHLD